MPNESDPVADPNSDHLNGLCQCPRLYPHAGGQHKEELEPWKKVLAALKGQLQKFLEATNQESAKTAAGTFFLTTKCTASISNRGRVQTFHSWRRTLGPS